MAYPKKRITFMPVGASHISEIYVSGLQYALVSDKHQQACRFVYCKDFFQDAYQGYFLGKRKGIYGFTYDPKKNRPLSTKSLNILVMNANDQSFYKKVPGAQDFLIQIEHALKMKQKTSVFEAKNVPDWAKSKKIRMFLFKSNKRWYASPVMISLYTLLVRVAFLHETGKPYKDTISKLCSGEINPYQSHDRSYMNTGIIGLAHIIKKGDRKVFGREIKKNFPPDIDINTMHDCMGIVAYSLGNCQSRFPQWYEGFNKTNPIQQGKFEI